VGADCCASTHSDPCFCHACPDFYIGTHCDFNGNCRSNGHAVTHCDFDADSNCNLDFGAD